MICWADGLMQATRALLSRMAGFVNGAVRNPRQPTDSFESLIIVNTISPMKTLIVSFALALVAMNSWAQLAHLPDTVFAAIVQVS